MHSASSTGRNIAIIGSGISGMSAAWLLSQRHRVTIYDRAEHVGGHANTVEVDAGDGTIAVDTGFIVFNDWNYPNLNALFDHLDVPVAKSDMSFAVSSDNGRFEYGGAAPSMLFGQRRNLIRPDFWRMLIDIRRFYAEAKESFADTPETMTLREYLGQHRLGHAFVRDHLLPMTAAIWSTPAEHMLDYPAQSLLRFLDNHGLLGLSDRPQWSTVQGGSREYVKRLTAGFRDRIRLNTAVEAVTRLPDGVRIEDRQGGVEEFDEVVFACHADGALALIKDPDRAEQRMLRAFRYQRNVAMLHTDRALMPKRRRVWASWNYLTRQVSANDEAQQLCVSYWMNRLQPLPTRHDLFVTLNPVEQPAEGTILRSVPYDHPVFDAATVRMRSLIWNIQGHRNTWFCGSYLGDGFHEDGIQAGLAVAEALGGVRRPWDVENESGRLSLPPGWPELMTTTRKAA